jgi:DNA-binding NarL/FixJ family response regulator
MPTYGTRILIIEDNIILAGVLAELLELEFPTALIKQAATASAAIAAATRFNPNVIISDGDLGGQMNGSDTVRILRSNLGPFKALLMSNTSGGNDGIDPTVFDATIHKPASITDVLSVLYPWLKLHI